MKRSLYIGVVVLLISHCLTEAYMLVWLIWPSTANTKLNLFISQDNTPNMSVLWYLKDLSDGVLWAVTYFFFAFVALMTSRKLFIILCILTLYHCLDGFMYMYNYKSSRWLYLALLSLNVAGIIVVMLPIKDRARIINLQ